MKRFLTVASALTLAFVVYKVWAGNYINGVLDVAVRTDTAVASTRSTGNIYLWKNAEYKSIVGDIVITPAQESTGTSLLESTRVLLKTTKGAFTYTLDSFPYDTDTLPDTFHIVNLGNDTTIGQDVYIAYVVTDTFNHTHNVPITWRIFYNLVATPR